MDEKLNVPRVLVFEKNKMVLRKLEKILFAAQVEVVAKTTPPVLDEIKKSHDLIILCEEYINAFLKIPKNFSPVETIVLYENNIEKLIKIAASDRRINHLIAKQGGIYPRSWEVLYTVRRLMYQYKLRGLIPLLDWSARIHEVYVPGSKDMGKLVDWIPEFCEAMGAPPKVRESFAELGHEMLMNAIYDAPTNDNGEHIYAHKRKEAVVLEENKYPLFSIGTNGELLGITTRDIYGGLKRKHVFKGLERALTKQGELNVEGGGAGLGMYYMYNHGFASFFNVSEGNFTEVTVLYDMSMNRREFSSSPKSIHFFVE